MKIRALFFAVLFLSVAILGFVPSGAAAEGTAGDYVGDIASKFGRGLSNIITSPVEVPCNIAVEMQKNASLGFFTGAGKGLLFTLRRMLVGVDEVATFMIPMGPDLKPVCYQTDLKKDSVQVPKSQ